MNRSKKLYILLGILAVACVATFAVMQTEERKEQIKETGETILELPGESVRSLSWEYNEETLAFHKDETWLYDEDENFPVSEEKINELLEQFQTFGAAFIIEDVEDFGQYGLDDPICTISLSTEDQDYEIRLGDYSKMDSQRYVSIGDGNVYLVKHDPLDEYDAVLSDMIDHDEIPSFDRVTKIQFAGAATYSITYQEDSTDSYSADDIYFTQQNGKTLPLDTSKVEDYLRSLTNLNPVNYVSYNVTDEELQTYGLDAPELTVMRRHATPIGWPRRDPRHYRFTVPNTVWEYKLKPVEFVIFSYLCYHRPSGTFTPEVIATGVHMTTSTVKKYLEALVDRGLVTAERSLALDVQCITSEKFFTLPNEVFLLNLSPSAFLVYAYLLLIEDRRTHNCHPSYNTISAATGVSKNTAMKSIGTLLEMGLITAESSSYFDKRGMKWKGNNLYTILPVRAAMDAFHQRRLHQLELDTERRRVLRQQAEYDRRHPRAALCAPGSAPAAPDPPQQCKPLCTR